MANNLDLVSINNSLAVDVKKAEIKKQIVDRLSQLGINVATYKHSAEFTLLCCNLLEHLVDKKKFKSINKKELCIEILDSFFNFTPQEKLALESNIEFLHQNKNIKKVSAFKLFCVGVKEFFGYQKK
jgi:hypothetical protein